MRAAKRPAIPRRLALGVGQLNVSLPLPRIEPAAYMLVRLGLTLRPKSPTNLEDRTPITHISTPLTGVETLILGLALWDRTEPHDARARGDAR